MSKKMKMDEVIEEDEIEKDIEVDDKGHIICIEGDIIKQKYQVKRVLGEGAFGRVVHVKDIDTEQYVALKIFKNHTQYREAAKREVITSTIIECRDLHDTSLCVKMLDWFDYYGHVCVAYESLGMSIFNFMEENDFEPYSLDNIRHITYQLCHAINFLHTNGITHTDVKPENVLFVNSAYSTVYDRKKERFVRQIHNTAIRLIDFGCAVRDQDYHNPIVSTSHYRAPEVILGLGWNNACDVWSTGCTVFELYFGNLLFPTIDIYEQLAMMERVLGAIPHKMVIETNLEYNWREKDGEVREYCRPLKDYMASNNMVDKRLFNLISQMLEFDPSRRVTLSEAMCHMFFDKLPEHQRIITTNVNVVESD